MGGQRIAATVTAIGNHATGPGARADWSGDWMLVRFDRCVGERLGYFGLLPGPIASSPYFHTARATAAGYPDGARSLVASDDCAPWAVLPDGTIQFGCTVVPGQSGGPVFVREADGKLLALGIVSAGGRRSAFSYAADVVKVAEILGKFVAR